MFRKKQVSHIHTHTLQHTPHVHHAHTNHIHMFARVYACTHCGHKGHLAKFYYDKINSINFANKNVWVWNTNVLGPKKIWVSKSTPILFDVGVGSHMTWELLVPWGECVPS